MCRGSCGPEWRRVKGLLLQRSLQRRVRETGRCGTERRRIERWAASCTITHLALWPALALNLDVVAACQLEAGAAGAAAERRTRAAEARGVSGAGQHRLRGARRGSEAAHDGQQCGQQKDLSTHRQSPFRKEGHPAAAHAAAPTSADGQLAAPPQGLRQPQARHVSGGDEQHEHDRATEDEQDRPDAAGDLLRDPHQVEGDWPITSAFEPASIVARGRPRGAAPERSSAHRALQSGLQVSQGAG
jgi:hypothetical protein